MSTKGLLQGKGSIVFVTVNPDKSSDSIQELEEAGFEVNIVKEASKAVSISDYMPKRWKPSLFIIDVVLSQMSGYELTRRVLDKYHEEKIPVILMSHHLSPEDKLEAVQSGAITLLEKPVTWSAVHKAVEKEKARRLKNEQMRLQAKNS